MKDGSEIITYKLNGKYFRLILLASSALGGALSVYLTYLYYAQIEAIFCGKGSGCDVVGQSAYSVFLGVPVASLGIIGYSIIFILTIIPLPRSKSWLLLYLASLAGFIFSAYLTYIEIFVINAICFYCIISALIMTLIFILVLLSKAKLYPKLSMLKTSVLSVFVVIIVIIGSMALQSVNNAQIASTNIYADDFQLGLAKHLSKQNAVMYGSFKCFHCNQQKELFGGAFTYIRYVECHPEGEGANLPLCLQKGIKSYPTWEIKGNYYKGTRSLEKLSAISGYREFP